MRARYWKRLTHYREFRPEDWLNGFYRRHLFQSPNGHFDFIAPRFEADFRGGAWRADLSAFDKVAALRLWLEGLE